MPTLEVIQGDISMLNVDAIVNAANNSLLGGGGVDGAIHQAAGNMLLKECKTLNGCPTGEARITGGYNLPAKYVIHTVGPIWKNGKNNETGLLRNAYTNSLELAAYKKLKSIAFPNISTGVYGFPKKLAANIAIEAVSSFTKLRQFERVLFVCFDKTNFNLYKQLLT